MIFRRIDQYSRKKIIDGRWNGGEIGLEVIFKVENDNDNGMTLYLIFG